MHFKDLSLYVYDGRVDEKVLNVGWLDEKHPYKTKEASEDFLNQLFSICQTPVNTTRGYHQCPFCKLKSIGTKAENGLDTIILGSAEIRVEGQRGIVYAAPNLIYHYVETHGYLPPEEFIAAVLASGSVP